MTRSTYFATDTLTGRLIWLAALGALLGRAWQCLFWDIPLRSLLWDEALMKDFITHWFQWTWESYMTSPAVDQMIERWIIIIGLALVFASLASVSLAMKGPGPGLRTSPILPSPSFGKAFLNVSRMGVLLGSVLLGFIALLIYKEKFFWTAQLLEYSLQVAAPLYLLLWHRNKRAGSYDQLYFWMKVGVTLTFISHGLFAIGFYPRPGHFVQMVMDGLWLEEAAAIHFLNVAAVMDFIVGLGLWIMPKELHKPFLWYAFAWGLLTTMARLWANWTAAAPWTSLELWTYETLYRFPHFLIPLVMISLNNMDRLLSDQKKA